LSGKTEEYHKKVQSHLILFPFELLTTSHGFQIVQTVNITGQQLDCIVLSRSNQMMFVAAENGSVLSVNYPLQKPIQYAGYNMHDCPVTRVSSTSQKEHRCEHVEQSIMDNSQGVYLQFKGSV